MVELVIVLFEFVCLLVVCLFVFVGGGVMVLFGF